MNWVRERVLNQEVMAGVFLNLGSSLTAEMAGQAGFDFVIIDMEHGSGDHADLLVQLQALESSTTAGIVRIAFNETPRFKRVLDLGAAGVMVPWVNNAEEARAAARAMRYAPEGVRGVAGWNRPSEFGPGFADYFATANDKVLTIIQIETPEGLENAEAIAAIPGVDVLFVGPADLSVSLGIAFQFEHPTMCAAYDKVIAAARRHGKAAGILAQEGDQLTFVVERGFTFITYTSDGGSVAKAFRETAALFAPYLKRK